MHTYTGVPASTGIVVGPVEQIDHGTTGLHRIVCDPFRERASTTSPSCWPRMSCAV